MKQSLSGEASTAHLVSMIPSRVIWILWLDGSIAKMGRTSSNWTRSHKNDLRHLSDLYHKRKSLPLSKLATLVSLLTGLLNSFGQKSDFLCKLSCPVTNRPVKCTSSQILHGAWPFRSLPTMLGVNLIFKVATALTALLTVRKLPNPTCLSIFDVRFFPQKPPPPPLTLFQASLLTLGNCNGG